MDVMLVLNNFCMLSGLSTEEAKSWLPLCHWAVASIYGKLEPTVDLAQQNAPLCYAAGAMAYYKYVLRTVTEEGSTSFSAGDVKVSENAGHTVTAAKEIYQTAMDSIAHLMQKDDFYFMGVMFS